MKDFFRTYIPLGRVEEISVSSSDSDAKLHHEEVLLFPIHESIDGEAKGLTKPGRI